jgi:hypothetical protein
MNSESWCVVAAQELLPGVEILERSPIVEDAEGRYALLASGGRTVRVVSPSDYEERLGNGQFWRLPGWSYRAGHVVGLVSNDLRNLMAELTIPVPRAEIARVEGWGDAWYLAGDLFREFRKSFGSNLLRHCEKELARAGRGDTSALVGMRERLRHGCGVAPDGSAMQLRFALLLILHAEMANIDVRSTRNAAQLGTQKPLSEEEIDLELSKMRTDLRAGPSAAGHQGHRVVRRDIHHRYEIPRAA